MFAFEAAKAREATTVRVRKTVTGWWPDTLADRNVCRLHGLRTRWSDYDSALKAISVAGLWVETVEN